MMQSKTQLAHLYHGSRFIGYGIAVDGKLLSNQVATVIDTDATEPPTMRVTLRLDDEMNGNPVKIDVNEIDSQ
ncbi:hypothetical protein [Erwinia sp. Leaf53]|uniref:hypothetical protein n=1 Tax=Erwinia sp. Leaf53 TaxID=1736225 RepID=UPI0006FE58D3|nr:hypothetical protein [Erwinia sp. Leaf53]KQN56734.1 hypothetical protein ASF13_06330 [Erwinia sp. Leaf53]